MSKCECNIESEPIISITSMNISIFDIPIDTKRLYNNFIGETSSNIEIIKCYYLLFYIDNLIENIGSYIILFIIMSYIFCNIYFCFKGYKYFINKTNHLFEKIRTIKKKKKTVSSKNINANDKINSKEEEHKKKTKNDPIKKIKIKNKNNLALNYINFNNRKFNKKNTYSSFGNTNKTLLTNKNDINSNKLITNGKNTEKRKNTYIETNNPSNFNNQNSKTLKMNDYEKKLFII